MNFEQLPDSALRARRLTAGTRRALVLGATGHLGNAIARELLQHGWRVTAATRQTHPSALTGLNVETVRGDVEHPGQIAAWAPSHELVVDAAAPYPLNLFGLGGLDRARRRTAALLDAVAREGATLGYVSSYTTLPRPDGEGALTALEAQVRRRMHGYFAVKSVMEGMVLDAARRGLSVVIVNPSACLGPWDRRPRELCVVPMLVTGQVPALMNRMINVIDVRDVAAALRTALAQHLYGVPIALSGHNCRTDALAKRVCALAHATAPRLRVPARVAVAGLMWAEAAYALVGRRSPLPSIGPLLVLDGYVMTPSVEQRALGIVPRPLDDTLRDAIDWYRGLGYC
jgi:dihydroflavonol-4-reductase